MQIRDRLRLVRADLENLYEAVNFVDLSTHGQFAVVSLEHDGGAVVVSTDTGKRVLHLGNGVGLSGHSSRTFVWHPLGTATV